MPRRWTTFFLLLLSLMLVTPRAWAQQPAPATPAPATEPSASPSASPTATPPQEYDEPNYYVPFLKGEHQLGFEPDMALFQRVRAQIHEEYVDNITDQQLLEGVKSEAGKLLAQASVSPDKLNALPVDEHLPQAFVDAYSSQIKPDLLWYATIRGEMSALKDPYSVLMIPDDFKHMMDSINENSFGGVGIYIELDKDNHNKLTVVEPIDNTPAANAGLQPGDVIAKIDGKDTDGMSLDQAATMLRGPKGSQVHVVIDRKDAPEKEYALTRAAIHPVSVSEKMLDNGIGYVRLRLFGDKSTYEMQEALDKLKAQGMKALIFDLRNNGGGFITTAQDICSMFLNPGDPIVSVEPRTGPAEQYRARPTEEGRIHVPMVLLVNNYSASASEITAGCMKDLGIATLVGVKTFGKGSVQNVMHLPQGAALKLTIAHFFSPHHNIIHHVGVTPDVVVPMEARLVDKPGDVQLAKAIDILKSDLAKNQTGDATQTH
ncbi:MAG: S41 family peptidase [Candidatus Xenobia bacterium]